MHIFEPVHRTKILSRELTLTVHYRRCRTFGRGSSTNSYRREGYFSSSVPWVTGSPVLSKSSNSDEETRRGWGEDTVRTWTRRLSERTDTDRDSG